MLLLGTETCLGIVTRLAVHSADEYEAECDGSFHTRLHMLQLQCAVVLSAPAHDVRLSARVQRGYRILDILALVVGA